MKQHTLVLSVLGLTLLLAGVGAWAQGEGTPGDQGGRTVQPIAIFKGTTTVDETKMLGVVPAITDQATLSALWLSWGIPDAMPTVDFTKQAVIVSHEKGGFMTQSLTLDNTGNLTVTNDIDTPDAIMGGFLYVISVISSAGITSVNGVALPPPGTPVPILRSVSSAITSPYPITTPQFQTFTDEKTWDAFWGPDTKAPVTVDFTKEEALLATMGVRYWYGYSITITGVTATAHRQTATVTQTFVNQGPPTTSVCVYPYDVVVISKSDVPVYYTEFADGAAGGGTVVPILSTISVGDSQHTTPGTAVIKDVAAWKELYDKWTPAGTALPEVDFGADMALVIFQGVTFQSVKEVNGNLVVAYYVNATSIYATPFDTPMQWPYARTTAPAVTPAPPSSHPWTAIIVPRSDLPVAFSQTPTPITYIPI